MEATKKMVEAKMLINGQKKDSSNNRVIEIKNMFNMETIGTIPAGTAEDVKEALIAAQEGAKVWAATPTYKRVEIFKNFLVKFREKHEELAQLLSAENGKNIHHARAELNTAGRVFEGFAEESKRLFGETIPLDIQQGLEKDLMITKREPLGVIAGILPFNFPTELFAQKAGAALAAGNAIVVKPPEDDSLAVIKIAEMLLEAGVPGNVLQIVTGYGEEAGAALGESNMIDAISFTGSSEVGKIIAQKAGQNLIRVFLELSGNDAMIICEDTDIDEALQHAVDGRLLANGQVCIATKRILVEKSVYQTFKEKLIAKVSSLSFGDQLNENTVVGPVINLRAAEKIERQIQQALSEGATLLLGGKRDKALVEPTILEVTKNMSVSQDDEIFGPVFSIMSFDNLEEAIEIANNSSYGLNSAIFTNDIKKAIHAANKIQAGLVSVNGSNCYRPDCSAFGGYKKSGIGREGTSYTLEEFTQIKSIALRGVMDFN